MNRSFLHLPNVSKSGTRANRLNLPAARPNFPRKKGDP